MKARTRTRRPPDLALACALAATVAGCDTDPGAKVVQRDVYQSLSDCVIDWGSVDLCQQQRAEAEAKAKEVAAHGGGSGGGGSAIPSIIFFGPSYTGERAVTHNGNTLRPTTSRATQTAAFTKMAPNVKPTFSAPKPAGWSAPSRGGWGGAGHSMTSGG